ncbi:uncharacterized protein TNCT_548931 [Trichonephila clavata]|uniref:Uncharacterized protein n=1 Tax=Trichonephila clavata TaxID=2740835 RepID=A0A8X6FV85_TRICU|nr:uncharacterized protein TNCT_548931 [Trichonephila clavata]
MKMSVGNALIVAIMLMAAICVEGQQRGSFNFAKKTGGEREGDLTPSAIAGVTIACVGALVGLGVTVFFCMYVYRQQKQYDSSNSSFDPSRRI